MLDSKRRHRHVNYRLTKVRVFFSRRFSTDNLSGKSIKSLFIAFRRFIGRSHAHLQAWERLISKEISLMKQVRLRFCVPRVLVKENVNSGSVLPTILASGLAIPIRALNFAIMGVVAAWRPNYGGNFRSMKRSRIADFVENNVFASIIRKRRRGARKKKWLSGTLLEKAFWLDKVVSYLYLKKSRLSFKRMALFSRPFGRLSALTLYEKNVVGIAFFGQSLARKQKKVLPKWYF
jgi:hypothetical protein